MGGLGFVANYAESVFLCFNSWKKITILQEKIDQMYFNFNYFSSWIIDFKIIIQRHSFELKKKSIKKLEEV